MLQGALGLLGRSLHCNECLSSYLVILIIVLWKILLLIGHLFVFVLFLLVLTFSVFLDYYHFVVKLFCVYLLSQYCTTILCSSPTVYHFGDLTCCNVCRTVSKMLTSTCLLPAASDPFRWWTDDYFLQVLQSRMWPQLARMICICPSTDVFWSIGNWWNAMEVICLQCYWLTEVGN